AERRPEGLVVEVADDGIGLPAGFEIGRNSRSLGMRVVGSLTRQLGGSLTIPAREKGTCFRLEVPLEMPPAG
ncbi:ATP-binding protein, partial [Methylobacterium radiotolerans]